MRRPVELPHAYRLLNHGPTVLVTCAHAGQRNIMAAAWNMALDFNPPKIAIVIDKNTYTRELIEASGSFGVNIPCRVQKNIVMQVGSCSGRDWLAKPEHDKFNAFGLQTFFGAEIEAPMLEGCVGWLECKVIPEPHNQSTYDLFLAEVVAAWADDCVFSEGRWHFEGHDELRTLHYIAGGVFLTTGETLS